MHKGEPIRELLRQHAGHLHLERLPTYAPMLNPVEQLWSWLKYSRLSNFAPTDLTELKCRAQKELGNVQRLDVLPFHQLGKFKWQKLGIEYALQDTQPPSQQKTEEIVARFRAKGLKAY